MMIFRKEQLKTILYALEIVHGAQTRMAADSLERNDEVSAHAQSKRLDEIKQLITPIKNRLGKK